MPLNEFFDLRSTSDNESKYMSFKPETILPEIAVECLYCNKKTIVCRMGHPCAFKDNLRFCNLPIEKVDNQTEKNFIIQSKILNKKIEIDQLNKTAIVLKGEGTSEH